MSPRIKILLSLSALYLATACAGWTFAWLGIPLPWMIGPLVLSAALSISGLLRITVPVILAQTTRIAAVVILVPIAVFALDGWPDRSGMIRGGGFDPVATASSRCLPSLERCCSNVSGCPTRISWGH
ncbi:hypothetical protein [Primorskyibacter sp. 2E107]|uniref:hypothetical protein n=1 Tax=Primorskyibacter sp. 2E107 TaxID=3403458 RepID=UPI003AF56001